MKRSHLILNFILLIACTLVSAQTDSSGVAQRMKITNVYVPLGFAFHTHRVSTLSDFQKLAPESILLDSNFNGYSSSQNSFTDNGGFVFSTLVGINFLNHSKTSYKTNPQLRVGVSYRNGMSLSRSLRKETNTPYDTLTSSQTGEMIFIDSVTTDNYYMNYHNEQLRVHLSLIFRTNPKARWSLYGGAGLTAGISFNSQTEINYSHLNSTRSKINSGDYQINSIGDQEFTTEEFINKNGFGFSAFIPLGIDWRVGNKREFWKRLHIYYELSPEIDFTSVPELRTFVSSGAISNFGLRVSLD